MPFLTQGKINFKFILLVVILAIIVGGVILAYQYLWLPKNSQKPVACTQEAKICPDGSAVGRIGPNCEFAPCPSVKVDETAGWRTEANAEYGFEFKYPNNFFDSNQEPRVLVGDCNYNFFPDQCPNINNIVIKDLASSGGDINAIKNNLSAPNYWKNSNGEKSIINNVTYCLYQTSDAAMSHVYNSYYYATVTSKKCLVVNLNTATTNCEVYLPLETGKTQQQINYNNCLTTNQNQPKTLSQILSTFKFIDQNQIGCNTDSDCQNGASCLTEGPIIANQPAHKVCVPKGQAIPL